MRCAECQDRRCEVGQDCSGGLALETARRTYKGEDLELLSAATEVEAEHYMAATRLEEVAIICKKLDIERVGLAFCIGMVEVSTCVIEPSTFIVEEGADPVSITRGIEIGHFEFGGSTHMMIFQKDKVRLEKWAVNAVKHRNDRKPTPLGSVIATCLSRGESK